MSSCRFHARGLTLLELLTVLAIIGIVLGFGLPAVDHLRARTAIATTSAALTAALAQARTAAVMQRRAVMLCPTSDQHTCVPATRWDGGWMVFIDADRDGRRSASDALLWASAAGDGTVRVSSTRGRLAVTYLPDGRSPGSNLTLSICARDGRLEGRQLVLSNGGRVRSQRLADCAGLAARIAADPS